MSRSSPVSRGAALLLTVSTILAGCAWFALIRWRPVPPPPDPALAALLAEAEQLRENTDAQRDTWRKRREGLRLTAWTQTSLDALARGTGDGWRWDWTGGDRATVVRVSPDVGAWPECVALVEMLGRKPGLVIDTIVVRAGGSGRERRFAELSVGLRFISGEAAMGDGARAGPSPGPPPVAATDGTAAPRKVGTVSPLRPASAIFRPDPPGSPAGMTTETKPQQDPP